MGTGKSKFFFIGIGVPRCGTTWTSRNLSRHPATYIPVKESKIFFYNDCAERMESLLAFQPEKTLAGEWTPGYFVSRKAIRNIKSFCPDAKLLINIRNPIERAWSWFNYKKRNKTLSEDADFFTVFNDPATIHYKIPGQYPEMFCRWYDHFPRSSIRIALFDDLLADPVGFMNETCRFLGIRPIFTKQNTVPVEQNRSAIPNKIRRFLLRHYTDHIAATKEFLGISVNWR